jgi:hypothetical protein
MMQRWGKADGGQEKMNFSLSAELFHSTKTFDFSFQEEFTEQQ